MNYRKYTLKVVMYLLAVPGFSQTSDLREPNPDNEYESTLMAEIKLVDKGFNFQTPVWISETRKTQADREKGIIVNMAEIKQLIRNSQIQVPNLVIRTILGHEKAHCNQFLYYPRSVVDKMTQEQKRAVECQADILAGKYLYESFVTNGQQNITTNEFNDELKRSSAMALELFFDLGEDNFIQGMHPSKEQRRTAFKLGRIYGVINQQKIYLASGKSIGQGSVQSFLRNIANQENTIAIVKGENIMDWSFRQAKRITHYAAGDIGNLTINRRKHIFRTTLEHPVLEYEYEIANKGSYPLLIDFDVRVDRVLKADPRNSMFSSVFNTQNYMVTLAPNTSYTAKGQLKWDFYVAPGEEDKYMPSAAFVGDANSFISVERPHATVSSSSTGEKIFNLNSDEYRSGKNIPHLIEKIRNSAKTGYRSLVVGPGLTLPSVGVNNYTTYACFTPHSNIQLIEYSSKDMVSKVLCLIGNFDDYKKAKAKFDEVIKNIEEMYANDLGDDGDLSMWSEGTEEDHTYRRYRFIDADLNKYFSINIKKITGKDSYELNLVFSNDFRT